MPSRTPSSSRSMPALISATPRTRRSSTRSTIETPSVATPSPSHEEIAVRAHELYVQSGFQSGREVEFWLEAERELKSGLQVH